MFLYFFILVKFWLSPRKYSKLPEAPETSIDVICSFNILQKTHISSTLKSGLMGLLISFASITYYNKDAYLFFATYPEWSNGEI